MGDIDSSFILACILDLTEGCTTTTNNPEYSRALHELWQLICLDGQEKLSPFWSQQDIIYPKQ